MTEVTIEEVLDKAAEYLNSSDPTVLSGDSTAKQLETIRLLFMAVAEMAKVQQLVQHKFEAVI